MGFIGLGFIGLGFRFIIIWNAKNNYLVKSDKGHSKDSDQAESP